MSDDPSGGPNGRLPYLRDAGLRFNRGREHTMDIKNRVRGWFDYSPDPILIRPNPPHGPVIEHNLNAPFAEWSVLLGEAL